MRTPRLLIIGSLGSLLSFPVCAQVSSFNTRTGAVVLNSTDINTALSGQTLVVGTIASPISGSTVQPLVFKNAAAGPLLLIMGGTSFDIEPNTDINLPGGAWGSGSLANGLAPIFQNTTFTGSTSGAAASFGMFLQQFDNSSNTNNGVGISEHLVMNGSSSVGGREGAQVVLDINTTGNTVSQQYVGVGAKCNLNFTETSTGSVCFGANPVASVGPGVRASGNVGMEVDTSEGANAIVLDRIGEQIVDVSNGTNSGAPGTRDDVAFSMNNAYGPTASLGFKVGVEFGRFGGNFPVSSGGTLIYAQGNQGSSWSAGNGVDWHLGTFSGDSWNDGHIEMTGTGDLLVGSRSSLATTAVHGFLSPPYTSGVPTGSPTLNTACAINVSTSTLNCYFGGAWHSLAFAGGAH